MNTSEGPLDDDFCYSMGNLAEACLAMKAELGCETFDECYEMMPEEKKQTQLPPQIFPLLILIMFATILANLLVTFIPQIECEYVSTAFDSLSQLAKSWAKKGLKWPKRVQEKLTSSTCCGNMHR